MSDLSIRRFLKPRPAFTGKKKCCYNNCTNKRDDEHRLFYFPKNPVRQNIWVEFSGNPFLRALSTNTLTTLGLCSDHFPRDSFTSSGRLHRNSNPVPWNVQALFQAPTSNSIENQEFLESQTAVERAEMENHNQQSVNDIRDNSVYKINNASVSKTYPSAKEIFLFNNDYNNIQNLNAEPDFNINNSKPENSNSNLNEDFDVNSLNLNQLCKENMQFKKEIKELKMQIKLLTKLEKQNLKLKTKYHLLKVEHRSKIAIFNRLKNKYDKLIEQMNIEIIKNVYRL